MTNNLRSHVASHKGISIPTGNLGGRASQENIDEAASMLSNCFPTAWQVANKRLEWYKGLFAGVSPDDSASPAPAAGAIASPAGNSLPVLPKKKDGTVSTFQPLANCLGTN